MSADIHKPTVGEGRHVADVVGSHESSEIEMGLLQMQIAWLLDRKPSHGYELMKELNKLKTTKITQGTLYPTLQRLEELGLIEHEVQERRKVYHITERGKDIMNKTCKDFVTTFSGIFEDFVCMKCEGSEIVFIGKKKGDLDE